MNLLNSELQKQRQAEPLRVARNAFGVHEHGRGSRHGFTLTELLVVMVIIGIVAAMALPRMKDFSKSQSMTVATRQLLDDVAYARQKAINDHTTVYMVFVPPKFWDGKTWSSPVSKNQVTNLVYGQCVSYALFSARSIGDQPGQPFARYITDWRELPEGVLFDTNKFFGTKVDTITDPYDATYRADVRPFAYMDFVFPPAELTNANPVTVRLPYIAFDSQGKLLSGQDEYLPLVRGSIFHRRASTNDNAVAALDDPDIAQPGYREPTRTNYNLVHIDWLTGRARVERMDLQ